MQETLEFINSNRIIQVIITTILAYIVSYSSIPVIITISRLKNLMDIPGERSSHQKKTPTLGGVAIFASILIGYFIAQGLWPSKEGDNIINLSVVALVILFFLGVKDDILVLSPAKKMLLQVASSALLIIGSDLRIYTFFGVFGIYEIPYWVSIFLTIFVFIALINAMNLIDGIDGLAGSIGCLASFIFGIWFFLNNYFALTFMSAAVCGGLIGFLRFNYSKTSKIFMGDTGSLILGFILTMFAVKYININQEIFVNRTAVGFGSAPIVAIIVLVVPIFDTLRVFLIRILNKKSPFEGDRNHLHHILIDLGLSHFSASTSLTIMTGVLVAAFSVIRNQLSNNQSAGMLFILFLVYLVVCYWLKSKVSKTESDNLINEAKQIAQNIK